MNKAEFLNAVINMTRDTGQGAPGALLRAKGLGNLIDELIKEKKITSTVSNYNHLPDDE